MKEYKIVWSQFLEEKLDTIYEYYVLKVLKRVAINILKKNSFKLLTK